MITALVDDRAMAKHPGGRPKKNPPMASLRIAEHVNELAREAGGIYGESITAYVTRVVEERAKSDILANAKRRIQELEAGQGGTQPK